MRGPKGVRTPPQSGGGGEGGLTWGLGELRSTWQSRAKAPGCRKASRSWTVAWGSGAVTVPLFLEQTPSHRKDPYP